MACKTQIKWPSGNRPRTQYPAQLIAERYGFLPAGTHRQRVAVLCLGGGYLPADVTTYCMRYGYPEPVIKDISISGAQNQYTGDPQSADMELALDVQTIIGATKGMVDIDIYFCPNTNAGYAAGVRQVAIDNKAAAATTSWGLDEKRWNPSDRALVDSAGTLCNVVGIPFFAASGDDGSTDGDPGNNVDFPSSSPSFVGCGGTTLTGTAESAWSYGGGGYSAYYQKPAWQKQNQSQRMVPDVAGVGDPNSGYAVTMSGRWYTIGGTSAVSPLWAAGVALAVSQTGMRLTDLASKLWQLNNLTDITTGSNGAYQAQVGPDPCTGLGVPNANVWHALAGTTPPAPPVPPPSPPPPLPPVPPPIIIVPPTLPPIPPVPPVVPKPPGGSMNILQIMQWIISFINTQDGQALLGLLHDLYLWIVAQKPATQADCEAAVVSFRAAHNV